MMYVSLPLWQLQGVKQQVRSCQEYYEDNISVTSVIAKEMSNVG